jgi:leucyl/phenylalanyl-tRNA---protein transferase
VGRFPDPRHAPADGPLAWGGDLHVDTLSEAYREGIFPWPADEGPVWWWSPDPRAIILPDGLHISRSLRRTLRRGTFHCTSDTAFADVVAACADRPGEGTWITPQMQRAYTKLHDHGAAHSIEVWNDGGDLVGGLYGVAVGRLFCGESMFHRVSDASKVAMVATMRIIQCSGFVLFDVQLPTSHLASMGAVEVSRDLFLDLLRAHRDTPAAWDATAARGDLLQA